MLFFDIEYYLLFVNIIKRRRLSVEKRKTVKGEIWKTDACVAAL